MRRAYGVLEHAASPKQRWLAATDSRFSTFKQFSGVLPLDPWKPDPRQSAQAMFLCAADPVQSLTRGLQVPNADDMRAEVLERLANMSVTAATLFPDLAGLARSLDAAHSRCQRRRCESAVGKRGDDLNAAIYARKSTEQSGVADEQKSVARQIEHARAYAERKAGRSTTRTSSSTTGSPGRNLRTAPVSFG